MSSKIKKDRSIDNQTTKENDKSKEKNQIKQSKKIRINNLQIKDEQPKVKKQNTDKANGQQNKNQSNKNERKQTEPTNKKEANNKHVRSNSSKDNQESKKRSLQVPDKSAQKKTQKKIKKQNSNESLKRVKSEQNVKLHESEKEDNYQNDSSKKVENVNESAKQQKQKSILEIKKSQRKLLYLEEQLQALERKQKQIEEMKIAKKQNYEEVVNRFRELAGKQIGSAYDKKNKSVKRIKQAEVVSNNLIYFQPVQQVRIAEKMNQTSQNNIFKQTTQTNQLKFAESVKNQQEKIAKTENAEVKIISVSASPNKTKIKFITEKQHELKAVLDGTYSKPTSDAFEMKYKVDSLNSTRRSLSLPMIAKNGEKAQRRQLKSKANSLENILNRENKIKRGLSSDQRIEKQRKLNQVAFMLTNLKEKVGRENQQKNNQHNKSKIMTTIQGKMAYISENNSFYSQSPNKLSKSKATLIQLSSSPSKTVGKQKQLKLSPKQIQSQQADLIEKSNNNITKEQPPASPPKNQSPPAKNPTHLSPKMMQKQTQLNNELEQIKQDIENENNEKEELLKQHRSLNKNLQIDMLRKRDRINKLQAEINKYKIQEQNGSQSLTMQDQTNSIFLTQLKEQKIVKEKQYRQEKDKLKEEIKKIEKKIAEQEDRYKNLRESQIQIKNQELDERQKLLEEKNKLFSSELQARNKQLQEIIKREQEKSKIYKQQLIEQAQKNQQISIELRKQEELERLLLQQIEKITKQRKSKQQKKEQQKNKEKLKLIQEIKQLEQVQNRILMEFQRDSQAANSMFEAMRLKNIELEAQINKKKKQKQKKLPQDTGVGVETKIQNEHLVQSY